MAELEILAIAAASVLARCNCQHFGELRNYTFNARLKADRVGPLFVGMDWLRIMVPFGKTYYISTNPYHSITLCHERLCCIADWL